MPTKKAEYLVSIDPGLNCTGYASFCINTNKLVEIGKIKPKGTDESETDKIKSINNDITDLLIDVKPVAIVIEMPSYHVNHNRNKGGGAGLGIYGFAAGAIWQHMYQWVMWFGFPGTEGCQLITVKPELWTKGKKKKDRTDIIAALYPMYNRKNDKGGDVADAIGLGEWWLVERKSK